MMENLNVLTSVNILKGKIDQWVTKSGVKNYFYLESFNLPSDEILEQKDVAILFGDFMASFAFLQQTTNKVKTIYVLCSKTKKLLDKFNLSSEVSIKVINRYELFPKAKAERSLPNIFVDNICLTYAGRISQSKNILTFLNMAYQLQAINPQLKVRILGEFDDFLNIDLNLKKSSYSYQKRVESFIDDHDWTSQPVVINNLSASEWVHQLKEDDLLVNFSTYWMDDFSVSVAQVQELGVPVLCTDIGGLSDIDGANVIKLPSYLFDHMFVENTKEFEMLQANNIIEYLKNKPLPKAHEVVSKESHIDLPSFNQLKLNQVFDFRNTREGYVFFKNYFEIWNHTSLETKTILYLVSNEQNHWLSLRAISENIKLFWIAYQQHGYAVEMINVDEPLDKKVILKLKDYEFIVAPSLSLNTINVLKVIRNSFAINKPIVAYAHELPSVFYSSLKVRQLDSFFTENDIMITQCEADYELTKASFEKINVKKIPSCFTFNQEVTPHSYEVKNLYYIGRISEQKGLHFLFWSLSLIKDKLLDKKIKLNIFGIHDHLGMPNWGDSGGLYLDFLGDLIDKLGLESIVTFHGFSSKTNWAQYIRTHQGVGVFPSLHGDENFGVAPFDLLRGGVPVILTKWGGFKDLALSFGSLVRLSKTYLSSRGPYLNPNELASQILQQITDEQTVQSPFKTDLEILEWVKKSSFSFSGTNKKLQLSDLAKRVEENLKFSSMVSLKARGWALNGVMFSGAQDKSYHHACVYYGAEKLTHTIKKDYIIAPWVTVSGHSFVVNDPFKGQFSVENLDELLELGLVFNKLF